MSDPFQLSIDPTDDAWSVTKFVTAAKRLVEGEFVPLWIRGEVVGCKAWPSGHWYFSLRDRMCQVRCCMWSRYTPQAGKPPEDGTEVFVLGRPGIYESKGEFQLNVTRIIPTSAIGAAQRELERVREVLRRDGLLDEARKRRIPAMASTVAVVTSTAGAALRDVITVIGKRWPCCRVLVVNARVQGDGAVRALARALVLVNRIPDVELCIVGRGGGGREDLAAFNSEAVCRALAAVRVPTISAVGHETDISLTDLVADLRAPTPSAAAEMAVADRREVLRQVDDLAARLAGGLGNRTRLGTERLARTADRLHGAMEAVLRRERHRADRVAAQLDALSPLRILDRGYAVPVGPDGHVLKRRAEFAPGAPFRLRVADGDVAARVESP
ncbi:MAG TPA: exodeoxyribonuclease VII large subunit [Gemmatimonadales bacterium]|jgi:exodeoxyribonuclease VII large subunit|nr:exodeoxyribonuclease VII large subunit [Gemmatimonadales bacterium]